MALKFCDSVINIIIVYIIIILVKRSDTKAWNNIRKIFIKSLSKVSIVSDNFISFFQGYNFISLISSCYCIYQKIWKNRYIHI